MFSPFQAGGPAIVRGPIRTVFIPGREEADSLQILRLVGEIRTSPRAGQPGQRPLQPSTPRTTGNETQPAPPPAPKHPIHVPLGPPGLERIMELDSGGERAFLGTCSGPFGDPGLRERPKRGDLTSAGPGSWDLDPSPGAPPSSSRVQL